MLSEQEKQILEFGAKSGKSSAEIKAAIAKYRSSGPTSTPTVEPAKPNALERVTDVVQKAGGEVERAISGTDEFAGRSPIRRGVEATAAAFGAVPEVALAVAPEPVRNVMSKVTETVGKGFSSIVDWLSERKIIKDAAGYQVANPDGTVSYVKNDTQLLEEALGTTAAVGEISGVIAGAEGTAKTLQKAADLTKKGATAAADVVTTKINQARPATAALIEQSKELIKPKPAPIEAVGEVLQGKTSDIVKGTQALGAIDTTGVKTYAELAKRLDDNIGELSRKVDDVLAQDPTPIPLSELVTKTTTEGGRVISRNYVETSLSHLRELYEKTADDIALSNVDDIIEKANSIGLTRQEVNDISRLYNVEFGSKAFNKIGDPLTSVNAQMYENIRSGLKDVARKGMGGTEAAATDKIISSLYNTKQLVQKNVEAVNKLTQKIAERGLLEKLGYTLSKYSDILTGGSIRGFIGGILPRGAGYKVMNAFDIEERLAENLKIIREAVASGSDDAITNAIKKLDASLLMDDK